MPETMFCAGEEWNISFAGCGFRSVYYMGALSCILERVPHLVQGASKISGASSGCLVAASLVTGIPLEKCIADVMSTAIEARRHTLGVFHPTFNLLKIAKDFLEENLPEDGHVRASGRLCVSLTRISNGKNVLVSEFDTREELIQVLMCSCFFPVYCGMVPPSYRGVWYMDGALSNNMPLCEQRNTITLIPFSGESDICPREGMLNFLEVNAYNVSIQINTGNVHRVTTSFCPPEPKKLAEICHNGYMDALHFLRENGFLSVMAPKPPCCELVTEETQSRQKHPQKQLHRWLDHTVIHNLPVSIKKVLCESCRRSHTGGDQLKEFLPVKVVYYLLLPCILLLLPCILLMELAFILVKSLLTKVGDFYRQTWMATGKQANSSLFFRGLYKQKGEGEVLYPPPLIYDNTPTSRNDFYLDTNYTLEHHPSH